MSEFCISNLKFKSFRVTSQRNSTNIIALKVQPWPQAVNTKERAHLEGRQTNTGGLSFVIESPPPLTGWVLFITGSLNVFLFHSPLKQRSGTSANDAHRNGALTPKGGFGGTKRGRQEAESHVFLFKSHVTVAQEVSLAPQVLHPLRPPRFLTCCLCFKRGTWK